MTEAIFATERLTQESFVQAIQQTVANDQGRPVIPVGGRSKSGFTPAAVCPVDMSEYSGIVTYDPSEYLITAKAGTRIIDMQQALAKHGQYLPFDPLWGGRGATLGGTVASGVSGPDRLLYGGVRDFVMEVAMIDGLGKVVRGGGKVVKNAAGFDIPKMMVGSYGRLGILLEVTIKVFPTPQAYATVVMPHDSVRLAIQSMQRVLAKSLPISSVMINREHQLSCRIAGPNDSLQGAIDRLAKLLPAQSSFIVLQDESAERRSFIQWLEDSVGSGDLMIRIGVSPTMIAALDQALSDFEHYHLGACSVTWAKIDSQQFQEVDIRLKQLGLSAVVVSGIPPQPFLGNCEWLQMAERIQQAIDPNRRFVKWV